jgi:ribose 5-phosphate isomerase B
MRVYLGSDHAGYEFKQAIITHLTKTGHEAIDCGAFTYDADDDYPAFCIAAAARTVGDPGSLGIVLGGSGNGEAIVANKVKGVRCGLCWTEKVAIWNRSHNDANVISLGERTVTVEEALHIVRTWLATPFEGGRHVPRVQKIESL